jgi:hypothetical protein
MNPFCLECGHDHTPYTELACHCGCQGKTNMWIANYGGIQVTETWDKLLNSEYESLLPDSSLDS